jgi:predicted RNase H-like nuclease
MNAVGVDACKAGWFSLCRIGGVARVVAGLFPSFAEMVDQVPGRAVIAVDIPIGLPEAGSRACDVEARKALGRGRGSSVFTPPLRPALAAPSWEAASQITKQVSGRGLTRQSWALAPRIREVDAVLAARPDLRSRIREVHPELSFWAWNDGRAMAASKRADDGRRERRQLVDATFGAATYDTIRDKLPRKDVADDDILDAFAALWTAGRIGAGEARTLPDAPPRDGAGRPMEIVY